MLELVEPSAPRIPKPRASCDIEKAAEMVLKHVPELRGRPVFCQVRRGALFLRGRVDSYHMKQHAQSAIMKMDGVERVCNELKVVCRTNQ